METRSAVSAVCDVIIAFLPVDEHLPPFVSRFVYLQRLFTCVADTRRRLTESCFIEPGSFAQNRFYGNKPDFAFNFLGFLFMSKKRWKKTLLEIGDLLFFSRISFFLLRIVCCCFRVKRDILNIFFPFSFFVI